MTPTRPRDRLRPWPVLGASLVIGILAMVLALATSGALAPTLLADPGAVVRWGRPVVEFVVELASALTIGALVLAAVVVPRKREGHRSGDRPEAWTIARNVGACASVVWTIAVGFQLVFTYASVAGRSLGEETFGAELGIFLTQVELGQTLLWALALTALTSLLAVGAAGHVSTLWASIGAFVALIPVAVTGHAAGAADHILAVGSMWLHLAGITVWIGGLAVLVAVAGPLGSDVGVCARRYSAIAAWAFAFVAISGLVNGYVRVGSLDGLATPYGTLLILKAVGTLLLGAAGWWHRSRTLPRLSTGRTWPFWRLVAGEILLAGGVMGIAVALSNTPPPVPQTPIEAPTPVEAITGYPVPDPPTVLGWFTEWRWDVLVTTGVVSALVVVTRWYIRLRRRGDHWPILRVISLYAGLILIAWIGSGGPSVYGLILFSAHMVQHMVLVMLAPIFLVLGAPVTLALRALPSRHDGTLGPRELLLGLVHSRWAGFFAHPIVAAVNVVASMIIFYYSPLFEWSLSNHLTHLWMIVHFTLAGYLFVNVLIGIDPGPKRPGFPMRLVLLFGTMAFHAFFGLALTVGTQLLAASWFGGLGLPWGVDALRDQQEGGAFAWGFGEIPSLLLAVALGVAWIRDDAKVTRRLDRAADRSGDAELAAYNARLAALAAADGVPQADAQQVGTEPSGAESSESQPSESQPSDRSTRP